MSVTPHYTSQLVNMPRAYMKGFVGCVGITSMVWAGNTIHCVFPAGDFTFDLVVHPRFYTPSSNVISLDYVFDNPASQVYQSGVPVPSGMWYAFYPMKTRPEWRIHILSSLAPDENIRLDLTPKANYWRPLW